MSVRRLLDEAVRGGGRKTGDPLDAVMQQLGYTIRHDAASAAIRRHPGWERPGMLIFRTWDIMSLPEVGRTQSLRRISTVQEIDGAWSACGSGEHATSRVQSLLDAIRAYIRTGKRYSSEARRVLAAINNMSPEEVRAADAYTPDAEGLAAI